MLKVVVDTNIIFSASFRGNPGKVIDLWKEGELVICVSQEILSEYIRVLKKAGFAADDLKLELIVIGFRISERMDEIAEQGRRVPAPPASNDAA